MDGDILVPIGDGGGFPAFKSEGIGAVRIVIGPICDRGGLAGGGVVVSIVGFVHDGGVIFYFCDLTVVSYDAVVSAFDGRGAGHHAIVNIVQGGVWDDLKKREKPAEIVRQNTPAVSKRRCKKTVHTKHKQITS